MEVFFNNSFGGGVRGGGFRGGGVVVLVFGFGFVVSGLFWFLREVFFFYNFKK